MTFAQETDYIPPDEPLNNLDIAASRGLMHTLQDLARTHGRTIVIVLHDINYAAAYADQIVAMKDGRITHHGAAREVVTDAMFSVVYGTSARVLRFGE